MNKMISLLVAAGALMTLLFITPSSAFAGGHKHVSHPVRVDTDVVKVTVNNHAHVFNVTANVCISGVVEQEKNDDKNTVTTGDVTCKAKTENVVNSTYIHISGLEE